MMGIFSMPCLTPYCILSDTRVPGRSAGAGKKRAMGVPRGARPTKMSKVPILLDLKEDSVVEQPLGCHHQSDTLLLLAEL